MVANTQGQQLLFTAPVAGTLAGIRINGSVTQAGSAGSATFRYAVVIVPQGYNPNTISQIAGDFYIPEQNVWLWGVGQTSQVASTEFTNMPLKTQQKQKERWNQEINSISLQSQTTLLNL